MIDPAALGPLSSLHELQDRLLDTIPPAHALRQYHPQLGSLAWYLGHSVYLETYWLRERLIGDDTLTRRVAHLFTPGVLPLAEQCASLPPLEHLRRWAVQIRDEHLLRLANPGLLPAHPWLVRNRLVWLLLQEQCRDYEDMLVVLCQRRLQPAEDYRAQQPLQARLPAAASGSMAKCTNGAPIPSTPIRTISPSRTRFGPHHG
jgi:gamma-glutamyl hercynylcysteine S-oxide synthase